MKILGYDPSSNCAGLALVVDDVPKYIGVWKPSKTTLSTSARLMEWHGYSSFVFRSMRPDRMVMEVIRVGKSHDVTRILSRFESVALVQAGLMHIEVIEHQVGQARAAYFGVGQGTVSKDEAHRLITKRFSHLPWLPPEKGGMDQSDALIMALAHEQIIERKKQVVQEKKDKLARKRKRVAKAAAQ